MNLSLQSYDAIKSSIEKALEKYVADGDHSLITDFHLQPKQETGELMIMNDDDKILSSVTVPEWIGLENSNFYECIEPVLRKILHNIQESNKLDDLGLLKPYSFVLVDEEKETIAELLLVDDLDTILLSNELLAGLDEELDAFLKELLEK